MSNSTFLYPPSPQILNWLAKGQLTNRLQRALRLWVLLHQFYGRESSWREHLSDSFTYSDLREVLFGSSHPQSEDLSVSQLVKNCKDPHCICHKPFQHWMTMWENQLSSHWSDDLMQLTGLSEENLTIQLEKCPFATVHRSIRDDLKQLQVQGWLKSTTSGRYQWVSPQQWPSPPTEIQSTGNLAELSDQQIWTLLPVLESVAFVDPNLEIIIESLWKPSKSTQRIFIELDYILPQETQDQVDTYQEQLDSLWHKREGGVIQFKYWIASEERQVLITVYPVCLHYVRRAKYLSAFGFDPQGKWGWHNYRLDRIASPQLKILPWGDPDIPPKLKELWRTGQLPLPEDVKSHLDEAWGFNFYSPRALLLIRFPPKFARWYVDQTDRHCTFKRINYELIPQLIRQEINNPQEQQQVLQILKNRPQTDAYYQAWIRLEDINVLMRLRDWRPNGEVIAPLSIRQKLREEALQELSNYANNG